LSHFTRFTLWLSIAIAPVFAQGTINTIPNWNGTNFISSFGNPNTATYGQTITVAPGSGNLTSWTIELTCSAAVTFRGEVYAWNGTMATGNALFETAPINFPASANNTTYTPVTFNTGGGISLAAGTYVLFASTSKDAGGNSTCRWGSVTDNTVYPGGQFVFQNNGTDPTQWTSAAWSTISQDLAFTATFTATGVAPIPGTVWLAAIGLLALGLLIRFEPRWRSRSST